MEGSSHIREVADYDKLATYYDELLGDEAAYQEWLRYIEQFPAKKVLEIASGSGVLAQLLEKKGYEVVASDLSSAMREVARKNGFCGRYEIINMIDFSLNEKFDLILCVCDSLNYLQPEELLPFFTNVRKHLKPDGHFIFDMHATFRLQEFQEEYIEEGELSDGSGYQWTILADNYRHSLMETFVFFTDEGIFQENHYQYVFDVATMNAVCKKAGIAVEWIENFIPEEKVLGIGRIK